MTCNQRSGSLYLAGFIFVILLNMEQVLGQCTFSSSLVNASPFVNDLSSSSTLSGIGFTSTQYLSGSISASGLQDVIPCKGSTTENNGEKIAREGELSDSITECEFMISGDSAKTYLFAVGPATTGLSDCQPYEKYTFGISLSNIAVSDRTAAFIINDLKNYQSQATPFTDGVYEAKVTDTIGVYCGGPTGSVSSTVTITGSEIDLTLICGSDAAVTAIKKKLTVIDTVDLNQSDGKYALLMDQSDGTIYCAKYDISGTTIQLAIEFQTTGVASCPAGMKASEASSTAVQLELTPQETTTTTTTEATTTTAEATTTTTEPTTTTTAAADTTTTTAGASDDSSTSSSTVTTSASDSTTDSSTASDTSSSTSSSSSVSPDSSTSGADQSTASAAAGESTASSIASSGSDTTTTDGSFSSDEPEKVQFPFYNPYSVVEAPANADLKDTLKAELAQKAGVSEDRINNLELTEDDQGRIAVDFDIGPGTEPTPVEAAEALKQKIADRETFTADDGTILRPYPQDFNHYNANGPCKNQPCQNRGFCSDVAGGGFKCSLEPESEGLSSRTILIILLCVLAALIFLTVLVAVAICNCRNKSSPPRRTADYDNGSLIARSWKTDYVNGNGTF